MNDVGIAAMPKVTKILSQVTVQQQVIIEDLVALKNIINQHFPHNGSIAVWLDYKVCFGLWQDGEIIMAEGIEIQPKFLERLRVFNTAIELYIWRVDANVFSWRLRMDGTTGEVVDVVDAHGLLWGQVQETEGAFSVLFDKQRNLCMVVPKQAGKNKQLYLRTRNYVVQTEKTGQVGYRDSRFVDIVERG